MRQAGRYLPEFRKLKKESNGFINMIYTPKIASDITLQPIRRFGFDAAIIFSDILSSSSNFIDNHEPLILDLEAIKKEGNLSLRTVGLLPLKSFLKSVSGIPFTSECFVNSGRHRRKNRGLEHLLRRFSLET